MTQNIQGVGPTQAAWTTSTSLDEVRRLSAASFDTQEIEPVRPSEPFEVDFRIDHVGSITLGDVTYSTDVDMERPSTDYRVNIPIKGLVESRLQRQHLSASPHLGAVHSPSGEIVFTRWPAHTRMLAVKIDIAAVDHALAKMNGMDSAPPRPPEFLCGLDLTKAPGRSWKEMLLAVGRQLEDSESLLNNPLVSFPFTESVVQGFLLATRPDYAQVHATSEYPIPREAIRKTVDLIHSAPDFPWTTNTLAERCYVSTRTLQREFRRQLGSTPMEYVRSVRLHWAHKELQEAGPYDTTVSAIAHRWGFFHLGRFSDSYKKMYGESPKRTLRT